MRTKLILAALAAIVAGCASTASWDTAQFPYQMTYGTDSSPTTASK